MGGKIKEQKRNKIPDEIEENKKTRFYDETKATTNYSPLISAM